MTIGERILLSFSRAPRNSDYSDNESGASIDHALSLLNRVYSNFEVLVSGKRVADFGCGTGDQSIALVKKHDCTVVAVDSNPKTLRTAIENARMHNVPSHRLSFVESISPEMKGTFDVVISQNSFEHFSDPVQVLGQMIDLVKDSGVLLLTFGPPWFAPYGSHMQFFCRVPWVNVLFSESAVMRARSHFRSDGAKRYEDVESGLNKMTLRKFESIVSSCGLRAVYRKYECVKGMNWLAKLPGLREFFVNHVTVTLLRTG